MHPPDHDRAAARGAHLPARARVGQLRAAVVAGAMAALIALPGAARAAPGCRVTILGDVGFGTYDPFSATPARATMRIRLDCPARTAPQIAISRGNSPTYAARELRSGRDALRYNLYVDPGHQLVWGDGSEGSRMPVAGSGSAEVTVYARIAPGQDVGPGAYTDTLVVTVFL